MLKSRIKESALARGIELQSAKNMDELSSVIAEGKAKRLVVDLSAGAQFAEGFKPVLNAEIESIGVIAHVDTETEKAALAAGFTKVIPRSVLVRDLEKIIN